MKHQNRGRWVIGDANYVAVGMTNEARPYRYAQ